MYASRNLFTVHMSCNIAVIWHIPLPNSSPCFKVYAIIPADKFDDVAVLEMCSPL